MVIDANPVLSIDTKKKEEPGNLTRGEAILCKGEALKVLDENFDIDHCIPNRYPTLNLNE